MAMHPVRRDLVIAAFLAVLLLLLAGSMALYVLADPGLRVAMQLSAAVKTIDQVYVEPLDWQKLSSAGRDSMFAMLDPYSYPLDDEDLRQLDEEMEGSYVGIGISILPHDSGLLVMSTRERGPADQAGIKNGDIILKVDSLVLAELPQRQALRALRGEDQTAVSLLVYRPSSRDTLRLRVVRARIDFQHVPFAGFTTDSMLYIRMLDFESGATDDLEAALDSLRDLSRTKLRGLILDLRGNPGGLFSEAFATAGLFLPEGSFIVGTSGRSRWNESREFAGSGDMLDGSPMIILVDRGSASAAEIVAGALKQHGRARLVGDTTFGKGLVQGFTRYPNGGGSRLTISRYYLEGGLYLNDFDSTLHETGRGLAPDYIAALPDQSPFLQALDGTLLFEGFAQQHESRLVADSLTALEQRILLELFAAYCAEQKFTFDDRIATAARQVVAIAQVHEVSQPIRQLADSLLARAITAGSDIYFVNGDAVLYRLRYLAVERRFGQSAAYRRVVVRERPDILLAQQLLQASS